jgi:hypothetical protein
MPHQPSEDQEHVCPLWPQEFALYMDTVGEIVIRNGTWMNAGKNQKQIHVK